VFDWFKNGTPTYKRTVVTLMSVIFVIVTLSIFVTIHGDPHLTITFLTVVALGLVAIVPLYIGMIPLSFYELGLVVMGRGNPVPNQAWYMFAGIPVAVTFSFIEWEILGGAVQGQIVRHLLGSALIGVFNLVVTMMVMDWAWQRTYRFFYPQSNP
jgi:hypothetical protein